MHTSSQYDADLSNGASGTSVNGIAEDHSQFTVVLALYFMFIIGLNDDLGQTTKWLRSKKLHINAVKTQVVLSGSRRALLKNPELNISLEGERLQARSQQFAKGGSTVDISAIDRTYIFIYMYIIYNYVAWYVNRTICMRI